MFSSCPKLKKIILQQNKLRRIPADLFDELRGLECVTLDSNPLENFDLACVKNRRAYGTFCFPLEIRLAVLGGGERLFEGFANLTYLEIVQVDYFFFNFLNLVELKT